MRYFLLARQQASRLARSLTACLSARSVCLCLSKCVFAGHPSLLLLPAQAGIRLNRHCNRRNGQLFSATRQIQPNQNTCGADRCSLHGLLSSHWQASPSHLIPSQLVSSGLVPVCTAMPALALTCRSIEPLGFATFSLEANFLFLLPYCLSSLCQLNSLATGASKLTSQLETQLCPTQGG